MSLLRKSLYWELSCRLCFFVLFLFRSRKFLFWLFHQVLIVICLHDAVEGGPDEIEQAAAFGVEQMVAVPDVQATEAEQVQPAALSLQADDAQGFLVQGAIGFDALHEPEPPLEVLIHIGLHAVEVPQRPFQDEQGVAGGRGAACVVTAGVEQKFCEYIGAEINTAAIANNIFFIFSVIFSELKLYNILMIS